MNKPVEEEPGLQPYTGRLGGLFVWKGGVSNRICKTLGKKNPRKLEVYIFKIYFYKKKLWYKHK